MAGLNNPAANTHYGLEAGREDAPVGRSQPIVLVADDDPTIRELAKSALAPSGFTVAEAADGKQAMAVFAELRPDLVLCDVMMPGLDGFSVCSALRQMPEGKDVPVVMLTGLEDMESIEKAYSVGATEFVVKPVNWMLLPRRVHYILRASRALQALKSSEERYALAAEGANDGLWDWDLDNNKVHFSPRWKAMLGYSEHDVGEDLEEWLGRIHPADAERVRAEVDAHLGGETSNLESEYRMRAKDGKYRWMASRALAMRDSNTRAYRMTGSQSDISARKRVETELRFNALHDALTGLPNRTLFLDRLTHCIERAGRQKDFKFAILFLDLDRFKVINDSLGHVVGDRLLVEVSKRISSVLRTGDTLARLGGDEFTILFEEVKEFTDVTRLVERIQERLASPLDLDDHELVVTASMGIAVSSTGYQRPEDMLRDADLAMYQAKAGGRARYEMFDSEMHAQVLDLMETESELRIALERGEFRLHYQPIITLTNGEIGGFEALLRWQHPKHGLTSPDKFLQVARDTQLIIPIGHWVLHEACRQMSEWHKRWPGSQRFVTVNLSTQELLQPNLVGIIDDVLEETGLDPKCLRLEIMETALINNKEQALEVTGQLRSRGVELCICDFGTENSFFGYIRQFPFNMVKIDRSFMEQLETEPYLLEILKALFELTHNLGIQAVAEVGDATSNLEYLKELSCEYAQGYSLSTPTSAKAISSLLESTYGEGNQPVTESSPLSGGAYGECGNG